MYILRYELNDVNRVQIYFRSVLIRYCDSIQDVFLKKIDRLQMYIYIFFISKTVYIDKSS